MVCVTAPRRRGCFYSTASSIPNWVLYLFLALAIAGSWGYLATQL